MPQPSEAEYKLLMDRLRRSCDDLKKAKDHRQSLDSCEDALQAVMHYLLGDEEVRREHLTHPLGLAHDALHNAGQGATVPLLNHGPEHYRPVGLMSDHLKAHLAFALELLINAGIGVEDAANEVTSRCRGRIHTHDGGEILATQLLSWRKEINRGKKGGSKGGASETTRGVFKFLRERYGAHLRIPSSDLKVQAARDSVGYIIDNLCNVTGATVPNRVQKAP